MSMYITVSVKDIASSYVYYLLEVTALTYNQPDSEKLLPNFVHLKGFFSPVWSFSCFFMSVDVERLSDWMQLDGLSFMSAFLFVRH